MSVFAEFEEKEYEIPLYVELAGRSTKIWSPGQVLEEKLGIDNAQYTQNATFWKIVQRFSSATPGIDLNSIARNMNIQRLLPTFRCNLFLQVKRPQYLHRRTRGYQGSSPYYRFKLDDEQQKILYSLASKIGNNAYIGYASPAFYGLNELYIYTVHSKLILNSTFIEAIHLNGHHYWAYSIPGTSGWRLSEPEFIERPSFSNAISQLAQNDDEWKKSYREDVIGVTTEAMGELARDIRIACRENTIAKNSLAESALYWMDTVESSLSKETSPLIRHYSIIQSFCSVYNVLWFAIG